MKNCMGQIQTLNIQRDGSDFGQNTQAVYQHKYTAQKQQEIKHKSKALIHALIWWMTKHARQQATHKHTLHMLHASTSTWRLESSHKAISQSRTGGYCGERSYWFTKQPTQGYRAMEVKGKQALTSLLTWWGLAGAPPGGPLHPLLGL